MRPDDVIWKSEKYRRFIRDHLSCYICNRPLVFENENYESHHIRHSGGKKPSDHLLSALCLGCHNRFHANESHFYESHGLTPKDWEKHCIETLSQYVESLNINPRWIMLLALQKVAEENE